jgi:hypothetical protein
MRPLKVFALGTVLCVSACGGGDGGGGGGSTGMYALGGHTAGLVGSGLSLSLNGGPAVSVS